MWRAGTISQKIEREKNCTYIYIYRERERDRERERESQIAKCGESLDLATHVPG